MVKTGKARKAKRNGRKAISHWANSCNEGLKTYWSRFMSEISLHKYTNRNAGICSKHVKRALKRGYIKPMEGNEF